ncbi:Si-specific NAD(P)(+) transhydrogenase [Dasania sp. GY-MA-18]|uniref:Soluble pyridine nucleotide transhydrogenase n=1 Tax=Dasania phycosphaerae TaxID=2950436 RepID=A0A9J6RRD0_9GAMM|nr:MULTISPECIES: Si-specific NAD(P)(+) transhydrogenase [Dasania]MCR8924188.1 Si-specific NAD(P)(+) transhydrogenase [Dasania sp. GY-MA-18]MCZ0866841.1 Si-specific NAD(P)(+) transhydrogenase [Dasania phycosphaerae]MCZ0870346.1 Si-specific NAD(P)(+) transhydrogenase [Dasania phycosphaerae]
MSSEQQYDIIVVGSGPAGQKAAVQAAKAGKRVAMIEGDKVLGGACVHRGTIPSKTLRENALRIAHLRGHAEIFSFSLRPDTEMAALIDNMHSVIKAHDDYIHKQIARNKIERVHGRASFVDNKTLKVDMPGGQQQTFKADYFVIATGSIPRHVDNIEVDHEYIYDSDSILSMMYLPQTLTVLGGGVIASEYASIFASLGVRVTMIDRYPRPLGFLDADLTDRFVHAFEASGAQFIPNVKVNRVYWDGVSQVITELEGGRIVRSEKLLSAAGRVANVEGLCIENAGLSLNERGIIPVDKHCKTAVDNIYAAGDVIGPPSLASASMEQGRRACLGALGIDLGEMTDMIPSGIYAIPELSTVGMNEQQARDSYGDVIVGYARFEEIARGQISGVQDGLLKLIACPKGKKLLGVAIVGEGATELIHIGQMALLSNMEVDGFVENIFNFPTLAEAYRVAALHIAGQRAS